MISMTTPLWTLLGWDQLSSMLTIAEQTIVHSRRLTLGFLPRVVRIGRRTFLSVSVPWHGGGNCLNMKD